MLFVCQLLFALAQAPTPEAPTASAPKASVAVLFENGNIRLGDGNGTVVSALLSIDGAVRSVGPAEKLIAEAGDLELQRVDLAGGWAVPGLQDAHGHVENYGRSLEVLDLRQFTDYASMIAAVAEVAAERPAGEWIEGRGWDQNLWPTGELPHHATLSAAIPDHPLILDRVDGHAVLVNKRALELSGLGGLMLAEPKVEGGRVLIDDKRQATGVLIDNAINLVRKHVPSADRETRRRRLLRAQEALLADGLTCVHDMGIDKEIAELYRELEAQGLLQIRIVGYLYGNDGLSKETLAMYPWRSPRQDHLDIIGIKLIADGALGSRGAALLADYSDAPGERGAMLLKEDRLTLLVHEAWQAGLQPAIHAIGDRANRLVLNVYERMVQVDEEFKAVRPRIEHAQVVAPRDWPRFPSLGVIPSMQPVHAASDMAWAPARLGQERSRGAYAWRQLAGGVAPLAFGSDFPVEQPSPLLGLHAAVTRQDLAGHPSSGWLPEQRLSVAEAIAAFSSGAAFAAGREQQLGRLRAGMRADCTCLDRDPFTVDPSELPQLHVRATMVDGELVYEA